PRRRRAPADGGGGSTPRAGAARARSTRRAEAPRAARWTAARTAPPRAADRRWGILPRGPGSSGLVAGDAAAGMVRPRRTDGREVAVPALGAVGAGARGLDVARVRPGQRVDLARPRRVAGPAAAGGGRLEP